MDRLTRVAEHMLSADPCLNRTTTAGAHGCCGGGEGARIFLCTHEGGPHVTSCEQCICVKVLLRLATLCAKSLMLHNIADMDGLAESPEAYAVVLVDPTSYWAKEADTRLETKLTACHTSFEAAVAAEGAPAAVIVAMEAVLAPKVIKQALLHCDVLAEKPACTRCHTQLDLLALSTF
eukprot:SAG31_NODE_388_length_16371_cov_5.228982_8_plen_178_part_00